MGPSGGPSALRGFLCSAKAHVGNHWKNKGKRRSPLRIWDAAVGCEGGDQRGPNPGQGFPKTVQKPCKNKHFWQNPLPSKFHGAICSGTSLDSVSFSNRPGPGGPQSAHAQNHWKNKGNHMFSRRRPKTPLMYSRLQQGSLEPASHAETATDLLPNSSQTFVFVV